MLRLITILGLAALSTGCATITRGTTEVLVIESEPAGADVDIGPVGVKCTTPCSVKLKRKLDYTVDIKHAGYETIKTDIRSEIVGAGAAGMAGNVLVGGLIGVGVDAMTGATKGLKPNPLKVTLVAVHPPTGDPDATATSAAATASSDSAAAPAPAATPPAAEAAPSSTAEAVPTAEPVHSTTAVAAPVAEPAEPAVTEAPTEVGHE